MNLPWVKCTLCKRYLDVPPEWNTGVGPVGKLGAKLTLEVHRKRCVLSRKK